MQNCNLSIFANYFIDTDERFIRLKDSCQSMNEISTAYYLINVRGRYAKRVSKYLKKNIINISVFMVESEIGWLYDSEKLAKLIKTPYVFLWIEDQICMAPKSINSVVNEMQLHDIDILTYTFWCNGSFKNRYSNVVQNSLNKITYFDHTVENNINVQNNKFNMESYLISYASIIKTDLFKKILHIGEDNPGWPIKTPFNFEKKPNDIQWLPLRRANPKFELFASIDDDQSFPGSSLQSRGLYPIRPGGESYATNMSNKYTQYIKRKVLILMRFLSIFRIMINTFKLPLKYQSDYFRSCLIKCENDLEEKSVMCYKAIIYIKSARGECANVFEFGSGRSTDYWLTDCVNLVSIECSPGVYKHIKNKTFKEVNYKLIEPELVLNAEKLLVNNKYSSIKYKGYTFNEYVKSIDKFEHEYFDVIIINPPFIFECIVHSISKLKREGKVIVTSLVCSEDIVKISQYLKNWNKIHLRGVAYGSLYSEQTTVFTKP
jgi:hypothetical protein